MQELTQVSLTIQRPLNQALPGRLLLAATSGGRRNTGVKLLRRRFEVPRLSRSKSRFAGYMTITSQFDV